MKDRIIRDNKNFLEQKDYYEPVMQQPGALKQRNFYPKIFPSKRKTFLYLPPKNKFLNQEIYYTSVPEKTDFPIKEKISFTYPKINNFTNEKNYSCTYLKKFLIPV